MRWNKQMEQLWSEKGAEHQYCFEDQVGGDGKKKIEVVTHRSAGATTTVFSGAPNGVSALSLSLSLTLSLYVVVSVSDPMLSLFLHSIIFCLLLFASFHLIFCYIIVVIVIWLRMQFCHISDRVLCSVFWD